MLHTNKGNRTTSLNRVGLPAFRQGGEPKLPPGNQTTSLNCVGLPENLTCSHGVVADEGLGAVTVAMNSWEAPRNLRMSSGFLEEAWLPSLVEMQEVPRGLRMSFGFLYECLARTQEYQLDPKYWLIKYYLILIIIISYLLQKKHKPDGPQEIDHLTRRSQINDLIDDCLYTLILESTHLHKILVLPAFFGSLNHIPDFANIISSIIKQRQ